MKSTFFGWILLRSKTKYRFNKAIPAAWGFLPPGRGM
jgi:hypothetical protein